VGDAPWIVLGPLLRFRAPGTATVWVETDRPCRVGVLGREEPTFTVAGHHYGLVVLEGVPDGPVPYEVALDGVTRWPSPGGWGPPPTLAPAPRPDALRVAVGSCRVQPGTRRDSRLGPDALVALAHRVAAQPPAERPDLLLLVGDQVYADHPGTTRPRDFPGHARVYRRAWSVPAVRWLLSAVPSAMILDDHDVRDGWSPAMRVPPPEVTRAASALAAYWVYQHLGNLDPDALRADPLLAAVRSAGDGIAALGPAATGWLTGGSPFAHSRRVGPARLVVTDTRTRRVRTAAGPSILDPAGWRELDREVRGDADHLVLVTSVPAYMTTGLHHLEAWAAALLAGGWGAPGRALGRRLRRAFGLEHWPAQGDSLERLTRMLSATADGRRGAAPATVLLLNGEVHHGRVDRVRPRGGTPAAPVWQVTSSPLRNPLGRRQRALIRCAGTPVFGAVMRAVARTAGAGPAPAGLSGWGPLFANHVALLDLRGRRATVRMEAATRGAVPGLRTVHRRDLTP
jgi:hypothetical protein